MLQRASCAVTAVGLQRTKDKMFDDNPYVENTPSPTSVNIKGILLTTFICSEKRQAYMSAPSADMICGRPPSCRACQAPAVN